MAEKQASVSEKMKIGALIALGAIVLWFLIVNLFTYCEISLWPFARLERLPGTLFIVFWLAVGFASGFGACYVWLRRKNLGKALDILADKQEKPSEQACAAQGSAEGSAKETAEEKKEIQ